MAKLRRRMQIREHMVERKRPAKKAFFKGVGPGAMAHAQPVDENDPGLPALGRLLDLKRKRGRHVRSGKGRKAQGRPVKFFKGKPLAANPGIDSGPTQGFLDFFRRIPGKIPQTQGVSQRLAPVRKCGTDDFAQVLGIVKSDPGPGEHIEADYGRGDLRFRVERLGGNREKETRFRVKPGPEAKGAVIFGSGSGHQPSGHLFLEHQNQERKTLPIIKEAEQNRGGNFVRKIGDDFQGAPPATMEAIVIELEGIRGNDFDPRIALELRPQDRDKAGIDFQGVYFFYPLRQRRGQPAVPGPDFHDQVVGKKIRTVHDPLKHADVDYKVLPQPLFRAYLQVPELLAKRVQRRKKLSPQRAQRAQRNHDWGKYWIPASAGMTATRIL
jgi:hypothetical protein